jgi:hypothetical protein
MEPVDPRIAMRFTAKNLTAENAEIAEPNVLCDLRG